MGCCDFELPEMNLYRIVAIVKNRYRTGTLGEKIECHICQTALEHDFVKKHFIGFSVRICCPRCGWEFEG